MWDLKNGTPYAAERNCVLDINGARQWIIAVKGTFDIAEDGTVTLAQEQLPVCVVHEFAGEDGASSLLYDCDLTPPKPGTDVVVHGHAHVPNKRAANRIDVALRVNRTVKTLTVMGERTWTHDVAGRVVPSEPAQFSSVPINYERAFGGFDQSNPDPTKQKLHPENPVGSGITRELDIIGHPAPAIELKGTSAERATAGLGPIPCFWAPRVGHAGTYDAAWVKERKPMPPLDMDARYHMCAPVDQQHVPHLRGDVQIELTNLTPSGRLMFTLPKVYLAFETYFAVGDTANHRGVLHTVIIEPEQSRLIMVWHTHLDCHARYDDLLFTRIHQKPYIDK